VHNGIVYAKLLYRSNRDGVLSFHVLAMLALNSDGSLKQEKIKALINIFRPQRDGSLSTLDFVKSVDDVVRLPEENGRNGIASWITTHHFARSYCDAV
jgi:hypothetical protein